MGSSNNDRFLQDAFETDWQRALVVSFPDDPLLAPEDRWAAKSVGRRMRQKLWPLNPNWNNYFCVSLFHGERRRVETAFESLCVLALDDVGDMDNGNPKIKLDIGYLLHQLGTPAWAIETSPGNQQWFYFLRPRVTELAKARALTGLITGNDAKAVTRLMRLPVGRNNKGSGFVLPPQVVFDV